MVRRFFLKAHGPEGLPQDPTALDDIPARPPSAGAKSPLQQTPT
jgi:hypothetical protein